MRGLSFLTVIFAAIMEIEIFQESAMILEIKKVPETEMISETEKFYMALRKVGTDFGLMAKIMPGFSRDQLKKKFKREEKVRLAKIDLALSKFSIVVKFKPFTFTI